MPHRIQWESGESICDQFRLSLTPGRKGPVIDAVLGILMFTMSDQIYVVRHNPLARFVASFRWSISSLVAESARPSAPDASQLPARVRSAICVRDSEIPAPCMSSSTCSVAKLLTIGAAMVRCASSQAIDTAATGAPISVAI